MTTFVNSELLGFTNLAHQLPPGLLRTNLHQKVDFLICGGEEAMAVCLEPSSGFMAFELETVNTAWFGCHISQVQLQADISSSFTDGERSVVPGDLVIDAGRVCVAAKPVQFGHLPRLVVWSLGADLGPGVRSGGFSRWRVTQFDGERSNILKEIDSHG